MAQNMKKTKRELPHQVTFCTALPELTLCTRRQICTDLALPEETKLDLKTSVTGIQIHKNSITKYGIKGNRNSTEMQ